ncbi:MAG: sigma-70 family RNA polymerase sigma factor [Balneolaceae bacterium]|nr:MAG: sigma-70 family RNA polymerase sigma factor [Balneolaceae bacterium]
MVLSENITRLLTEASEGNSTAEKQLMDLVYNQLHVLAQKNRQFWTGNETLNTTALVHEAYIKLIQQKDKNWENRVHFFAFASRAMRCILVDHAKRQKAGKRGSGAENMPLNEMLLCPEEKSDEVIALDEALQRLAVIDEAHSKIVEYRFFCGFNIEETAGLMGISPATVKRNWSMARSWLYREIRSSIT